MIMMIKFSASEAAHKSQLWRRGAARIFTEMRDNRIGGATRIRLDEAHTALIKAACAVQNGDKDANGVSE